MAKSRVFYGWPGFSFQLVGARGFEPRTPCAQGRCATRLRYAPTKKYLFILMHLPTEHPSRNPLSSVGFSTGGVAQ
jgi:hypothetical protein